MQINYENYIISDCAELLQPNSIYHLLKTTYWAKNRTMETVLQSLKTSLCFGVYLDGEQIGFARCVTDYATVYWLCDVIIDSKHRKKGIGSALVECIVQHDIFKPLLGILSSGHSKELYAAHGFRLSTNGFMIKSMPRAASPSNEDFTQIL